MTRPHTAAKHLATARPAETAGVGLTVIALATAIGTRNWLAAATSAVGLVGALVTGSITLWRTIGGTDGARRFLRTGH